MAAHRYWRLRTTSGAPSGAPDGYEVIAELQAAETIGGTNVITLITPTVSSNFDVVNHPALMVTDGTTTGANWWANTNTYPTTVTFDLGVGITKDIQELRLYSRNDGSGAYQSTFSGTLQYSDDNSNWFDYWIWTQTSYNNASGTLFSYSNPALWPATYWDFTFPATSGALLDSQGLQARLLAGSGGSVRTNKRITSSLTYAEMTIGSTLTGSSRVGICGDSFPSTTRLGDDNTGLGYDAGGTVKLNNTTISTIMTYTASDRIGVAVDSMKKLIWFRKNNGNWNNDIIGNQNPVGGVGGISFSTMSYGSLRLAWGGAISSTVAGVTAAFASASWTDTTPTGFVTIDTFGALAYNSSVSKNATFNFSTLGAGKSATVSSSSQVSSTRASRGTAITGAWYGGIRLWSPAGTATVVSGTVSEIGSPVSNKVVRVYDSATGAFLGYTVTDGSGAYSIPALGRTKVDVVAKDPTTYQAMIYDRVTPV